MSARIETTTIIVGPGHFRQWRIELGKTEAEMAAITGLPTARYQAAETSSNIPTNDHVAIVTAFKKLGKEGTPIERKTQ